MTVYSSRGLDTETPSVNWRDTLSKDRHFVLIVITGEGPNDTPNSLY